MIHTPKNILKTTTTENQTTYILKDETFIGDSFKWLPNGRIDKRVTGIGATYCELYSKRNSIIVEPLRAIASSKVEKHTGKETHTVIYVGGPTNVHPALKTAQIKKAIEESDKFIKIVVVADSLKKVIMAIEDEELYNNYFFMVDEIDTFQTDSGYRSKLEDAMDYYFQFNNRCVVSATLREFCNPELMEEPLSIFNYDNQPKKDITLTIAGQALIDALVAEMIKKCLGDTKPVLIAYNYVLGILNVIQKLPEELRDKCRVMCSSESKNKVGDHFLEFNSSELKYPVTFITSAYFSGIDIQTKCHVICVAIGSKQYTTLSSDRLRQIQGRLRKGILSNHLVCSPYAGIVPKKLDKEYILYAANKTMKALKCVQHVYSDDKDSGKLMDKVRAAVSKGATLNKYRLIRKSKEEYSPAYFNIDALLLAQKTLLEMYLTIDLLKAKIEQEYNLKSYKEIKIDIKDSTIDLVKENQKAILLQEVEDVLTLLESSEELDFKELAKEVTAKQNQILKQYQNVRQFLSRDDCLIWIRQLNINKENKVERDSRKYNGFYKSLIFEALVEGHVYKTRILEMFPIGSEHTKQQVFTRLNSINLNADIGFSRVKSPTEAMRTLKTMLIVKSSRRRDTSGNTIQVIRGINPRGLKLIAKLGEDLKTNEMHNGLSIKENVQPVDFEFSNVLEFIDFMSD